MELESRFTHGGKTTGELIQATRRERKNAEGVRFGKRALALVAATVTPETKAKINAVVRAAEI